MGWQCHGRQKQCLQLAGQAGDLRILGFIGLDQAGKLKDTCKTEWRVTHTPETRVPERWPGKW